MKWNKEQYIEKYGKGYVDMTRETATRILLYKYLHQPYLSPVRTEEIDNLAYKTVALSIESMLESDTPAFCDIAPQWYLDWKEYQDNIDTEVEKS